MCISLLSGNSDLSKQIKNIFIMNCPPFYLTLGVLIFDILGCHELTTLLSLYIIISY